MGEPITPPETEFRHLPGALRHEAFARLADNQRRLSDLERRTKRLEELAAEDNELLAWLSAE